MDSLSVLTLDAAPDFRAQVSSAGQPVVLKGVAAHWPAVARGREGQPALSDLIRSFYSGVPAPCFEGPPDIEGRFFYNETLTGFNFRSSRAPLTEVLDRLSAARDAPAPSALYVGSLSIPIYLPGFEQANHLNPLLPQTDVLESMWIGNRTVVAAHFDNTENIAVVVGGRRRFTLFPPDEIANLYVGPLDFTPAGQPISLVDIRKPDLDAFPRYALAMARGRTAVLEPGDGIYIPALWWHSVEALDPFNVLVNYWWREAPAHAGSPMDALFAAALCLKPLPENQRKGWKALFDHLVFQSDGAPLQHLPPQARGLFGELTPEMARQLTAALARNFGR